MTREILQTKAIQNYSKIILRMIKRTFPHLSDNDIISAVNYSIQKRYKEEEASIYNNYTKKKPVNLNLLELTEYIIDRQPIITASGVLFKRHGTVPNPLAKITENFMESRSLLKKEMFKYPKYSEDWEYYNLLQLLAKIDANGLYGVLGLYNSFFYDIHVAKSTTSSGRSLVSAAGLQFEMFLSNGVKFGSLNEVMTFIDNVCTESGERKFKDSDILDRDITMNECFIKIATSCGFEWIPTDDDLWLIYQTITKLNQEDINRLYYKNNLYEFMSNTSMTNAVIDLLATLEEPYLSPNECPKEIKEQLLVFTEILMEYVYYHYFFIDSIDRMDNMIKNVVSISDTDSTIISVDAWYRFVSKIIQDRNLDLKVMHIAVDAFKRIDNTDEFGRFKSLDAMVRIEPDIDYDFFNEEKVEIYRTISPMEIIPQDNLRYSIINILAFVLDSIINDYMERFTKASNSYDDSKKCLIIMKNEFLFKTALLTWAKKNYATIQENQEGNVFEHPILDVKGLAIDKSSMNDKIRKELKKILFEDILNVDTIDQLKVVAKLAALEDDIYKSLESGSKEFCKPATFKSINTYDDPMRIQAVKGAIVWNTVKNDDMEYINLEEKNSVYILKLDINRTNIKKIQDEHPEEYAKVITIIGNPDDLSDKGMDRFSNTIDAISIPRDSSIPKWLSYFIDYSTIVNDNIINFPLESIGINKPGSKHINYSNMISF